MKPFSGHVHASMTNMTMKHVHFIAIDFALPKQFHEIAMNLMQSSFEWSLLTAKLHVYSNCFLLPCWAFLAKKHSEIRIYHSQGLQTHLNTSNPIVTVETCRTRTWTFKSFHLLELIKEASTSNEHGRSTGEKGTWNHMESPNNHLDPIGLFQKSRLHYVARFLFRTFWTKAEGN